MVHNCTYKSPKLKVVQHQMYNFQFYYSPRVCKKKENKFKWCPHSKTLRPGDIYIPLENNTKRDLLYTESSYFHD